jgi:SNF2 family DNA or RNA helicase
VARSLHLELAAGGVHVALRSGPGYETALQNLSAAFPTATTRAPGVLEVGLDDLLVNLRELARWPDPAGVEWDPPLRTLAEDVVRDAEAARTRLTEQLPDAVRPDDVPALLGERWRADLTAFQRRDIAKLLALRHGANFSVPGAGKTRAGLAVYEALANLGEVDRLLVVCPKAAFESWQIENVKCFGSDALRLAIYEGSADPVAEVLLINYERLADAIGPLTRWLRVRPALMVLDEAHRMKRGARGAYGSACLALGPYAHRRLILTGTPAPNGAADLESLLGFVWPGHGRQTVANAVAGGDLRHASEVLRPLFTRTTKNELALPPVDRHVRRVELPPLHREIYAALCGQFSSRLGHASDDLDALGRVVVYLLMAAISPTLLTVGTTRYEPLRYRVPPLDVPADATLTELLHDLPNYELSPKYAAAVQLVEANARAGRKTLVWSTFIRSLTTLGRLLAPFEPAIVHGGSADRQEQLARFRGDADCYVLLSNPATLGEGISLHEVCHDAVYVDRDFAAGRYMQSLDRIHRLGLSSGTVTSITVLVADATIDDVVEQRLAAKLRFMGAILDDPGVQELADLDEDPVTGGALDLTDLASLLSHLNDARTR